MGEFLVIKQIMELSSPGAWPKKKKKKILLIFFIMKKQIRELHKKKKKNKVDFVFGRISLWLDFSMVDFLLFSIISFISLCI